MVAGCCAALWQYMSCNHQQLTQQLSFAKVKLGLAYFEVVIANLLASAMLCMHRMSMMHALTTSTPHLFDLKIYRLRQVKWLVIRKAVQPAGACSAELRWDVQVGISFAEVRNSSMTSVRRVFGRFALVTTSMAGRGSW